jgi:hypothetical protein
MPFFFWLIDINRNSNLLWIPSSKWRRKAAVCPVYYFEYRFRNCRGEIPFRAEKQREK